MKKISLTRGKFTLVDDENFEYLNQFKWFCNPYGYAIRHIYPNKKLTVVWMHRVIINTPKGLYTDHINGNKLDNRKQNLRICTYKQNQHNRFAKRTSKTGYKGISYRKIRNKYVVTIGNDEYIGIYKTLERAIEEYNKVAIEKYGKFAKLNILGSPY